MATPHVSGALALMLSVNGYDPTPDEAIADLLSAGTYNSNLYMIGTSSFLNTESAVAKAVEVAGSTTPTDPTDPTDPIEPGDPVYAYYAAEPDNSYDGVYTALNKKKGKLDDYATVKVYEYDLSTSKDPSVDPPAVGYTVTAMWVDADTETVLVSAVTGVTGADGMAIFNLDGLVVTPDIEDAKLVVIEP